MMNNPEETELAELEQLAYQMEHAKTAAERMDAAEAILDRAGLTRSP